MQRLGGAQIPFDDYILKLGEHLGMKTAETNTVHNVIEGKGLHSLECNGDELINLCIPTRKKIDRRRSIRETAVSWNSKREPYNVFISHIHENETVAKRLKDYLISIFSDRVSVFISGDPENIPPGQDWFATIIDGIRKCDCMIILCSHESVERKWIHFEAGAATALGKKTVPLCFAGLSAGALPSPLNYIRAQAIDSDDADRLKQHFEILTKEIAEYLQADLPILDVLQSEFYHELHAVRQ